MKKPKDVIRYSNAFKFQVVNEIDSGKYSIIEASRIYGINGRSTIPNWIRKFSKFHLLPKVIKVETPNEKAKLKELEKQVAQLKSALADQVLKGKISDAFLKIACQELGMAPEDFKKKANLKWPEK